MVQEGFMKGGGKVKEGSMKGRRGVWEGSEHIQIIGRLLYQKKTSYM